MTSLSLRPIVRVLPLLLAASACASTVTPIERDAAVDATDASLGNDVATDAPRQADAARRAPMHHRATADACVGVQPPGDCNAPRAGSTVSCTDDSQCLEGGPDGRCIEFPVAFANCECTYDLCTQDSDCHMGGPCACHGSTYLTGGSSCVAGNCRVDADCGAGGYCSPSQPPFPCGSFLSGYFCHTPRDTCMDDSDCPGTTCMYDQTAGEWTCMELRGCA